MANPLYRAAVLELEAVLPPRVVSQALHEGLAVVGKTAETLTSDDATAIMQRLMLPRLARSLGSDRAQEAVTTILGNLARVPSEPQPPALSLGTQTQALTLLQESLRPFNIYFEWSETQKLRAQLLLIESEHAAGRDASELIAAAQLQLGVVRQKLSDQLSVQARELALLETSLQASSALSNVKVRRLAHLLALIRSAQEAQQRVPAEIERAHKLAGELRAEKLQLLGDEARELRGLQDNYATLLGLEPSLAARLSGFQAQVEGETLLRGALSEFRTELEATQEALRSTLEGEFSALLARSASPELSQLLTLSLKVLETTLPPATDVQQIRDFARSDNLAGLSEFHRLENEAEPYRTVPNELGRSLTAFLGQVRGALAQGRPLPDLTAGWTLIAEAQARQARSAESFLTRLEALQSAAAPLMSLASEAALSLRWRLQSLGMQLEAVHRVSPKRQAEIEDNLQVAESLALSLQDEASAARSVAAQLIEGHTLDDILSFLGTSAAVTPSTATPSAITTAAATRPTPEVQNPASPLQAWLERQAEHTGITGLALFTESAETLVAGELPSDPHTLQRAVRLTKRRADTLGAALGQESATTLTLETPEHTMVAFWLTKARSLVLVTRAPTWGGSARQHLEDALPELVEMLEPS